jgi:hypothetical protein
MNSALASHFRCPDQFVKLELAGELSGVAGYFQFGPNTICFGRSTRGGTAAQWREALPDVMRDVRIKEDRVLLPFDVSDVAANLRLERYCSNIGNGDATNRIYYLLRPFLGVFVRKHLQSIRLRGWKKIPFPRWPVDFTVENLFEQVFSVILERTGTREIPFIWFWPDGARAAVIMTHDVEGKAGLRFSEQLMAIDESFGIHSAFQLVPEERYLHERSDLQKFWGRGFEVNVHDLNHDGALFSERQEFMRRAERINHYAKEFGTRGFRSGAMYRRQDWYGAFDLSYDMSVPNVAHLEPQRGGCCTTMPYFIGNILELPLTATQDYSLFHIIGDYSINLWKQQVEMILKRNGLISFIVHPDYIIAKREQRVYRDLLAYLASMRDSAKLWVALPSEVDRWWRSRAEMKLVQHGDAWVRPSIEGPNRERARVAFASLQDGHLVYHF